MRERVGAEPVKLPPQRRGREMSLRNLVLMAATAALGLQLLATQAWAGQRVALVIGNASYAHAPSLANPLNDATDIGTALDRLGFKVTRIENGSHAELWDGLQKFSLAASASEMAVVFYAGHGIEVDKHNFLIPVDARLLSDADVEFEAVPMYLASRAVERASGLRLIILDACRDNPFAVAMQRAGATRSIGRGLASVEPSGETLVAYAAKEGTVAADGEGRNSPYTTALLAHLEEPGLEVGLMFRKVRDAVLATTGGRQEPFVYGSLSSKGVYLAARREPEPTPVPEPVTVKSGEDPKMPGPNQVVERRIAADKELLFWESIKDSEHGADFEAYLKQFPGGTYESLARNRLKRMADPQDEKPLVQVAVTPDEPERVVSPEPPAPTPESIEALLGLERAERRKIQMGLASLGFDTGPADGLFGQRTRKALQGWQSSKKMAATGYLDAEATKVLLAAAPKTSITIATEPSNARVRVFTAAGSTYREGMSVQPGQYEIAVDAPHHESFFQRLAVDGHTTYQISLCRLEKKENEVCKDSPIARETHRDQMISQSASIRDVGLSELDKRFIQAIGGDKEKAKRQVLCSKTASDASDIIKRKCSDLGGEVLGTALSAAMDQCPPPRLPSTIKVSLTCRIKENIAQPGKRCKNEIVTEPICPKNIVMRLQ